MAGCPKCAIDIVRANPHKAAKRLPNGFVTFKDLREGEVLNLPEKWFSGELDTRPRAYFAALPHMDGVTPSSLGDAAAGVLADYAALDAANAKVSALAAMGDQGFGDAAENAANVVDASVSEIVGSGSPAVYAIPYAQDVRKSTSKARARLPALSAAIVAGNSNDSFQVRSDVLHDLSDAMSSARLALQAFYGDVPAPPTSVADAARAAVAAIVADPSYCTSVTHPGSSVNAAVHAFKTAWNSSGANPVPINTSNYEQATASALAQALGSAPTACAPHVTVSPVAPITPAAPVATASSGLSVGAMAGIGLLGAGVVGSAIYLTNRKRNRR